MRSVGFMSVVGASILTVSAMAGLLPEVRAEPQQRTGGVVATPPSHQMDTAPTVVGSPLPARDRADPPYATKGQVSSRVARKLGSAAGDGSRAPGSTRAVVGIAQTAVAPAATPLSGSADFRRGPSLYETGRVGQAGVSEAGVRIDQTRTRAMPKELRIDDRTADRKSAIASPPRVPGGADGPVTSAVLRREIKSRFALLTDCPSEVARNRRVKARAIRASRLTLRWTILPAGNVADTQVVATAPADGLVMNCVKREMSQWSFTPPEGGALRVERPFKFRSPSLPR